MTEMKIITAMYKGELKSLTVPQWANLLHVSKKSLYNKKHTGKSDQEVIESQYLPAPIKPDINGEDLNGLYQAFNFNTVIYEWRQKNGI